MQIKTVRIVALQRRLNFIMIHNVFVIHICWLFIAGHELFTSGSKDIILGMCHTILIYIYINH